MKVETDSSKFGNHEPEIPSAINTSRGRRLANRARIGLRLRGVAALVAVVVASIAIPVTVTRYATASSCRIPDRSVAKGYRVGKKKTVLVRRTVTRKDGTTRSIRVKRLQCVRIRKARLVKPRVLVAPTIPVLAVDTPTIGALIPPQLDVAAGPALPVDEVVGFPSSTPEASASGVTAVVVATPFGPSLPVGPQPADPDPSTTSTTPFQVSGEAPRIEPSPPVVVREVPPSLPPPVTTTPQTSIPNTTTPQTTTPQTTLPTTTIARPTTTTPSSSTTPVTTRNPGTTAPPTSVPPPATTTTTTPTTTSPPTTTPTTTTTTTSPPTTLPPTTLPPTTLPPTTLPPTTGKTIVLSPSGSDANPGTLAAPRRTLPKLVGGETVYLRGGTHSDVRMDLTNISNLKFLAYPGERPVVDGGYVSGHFAVLRDNVSNVVFSGLTITRFDDSYGNGAIVGVGNVTNIVIENNLFDANGKDTLLDHAIYLGSGSSLGRLSGWTIRNNTFLNTAAGGIHSFGANAAVNVVVEGNRFIGGRWSILISYEGESNWDIRNNTMVGATDAGIAFGYYARTVPSAVSNIRVFHNIISLGAGKFPIRLDAVHVASGSFIDQGNLYWAGGSPVIMWGYAPGVDAKLLTLAAFRSLTGQGAASVHFDPGLNGSLGLPPGSPVAGWGAP